jgi:hypothetical protein
VPQHIGDGVNIDSGSNYGPSAPPKLLNVPGARGTRMPEGM